MARSRWITVLAAAIATTSAVLAAGKLKPGTVAGTWQGPNSSATPYVVPAAGAPGWEVISLLTVGDSPTENFYPMVGIPDGLGALAGKFEDGRYVADKSYMTVFMHHELGATNGAVRTHGQTGAFISQWTVHLNQLSVKWGQDLIERLHLWNGVDHVFANGTIPARLGRLCSADLPLWTAFFNPTTGNGFDGRLFLGGEEVGNEGRAFATVLTGVEKGDAYELPYLGKMSWENAVAHPNAGDRTIVVALDDSTPGQVYVYVGTKQPAGAPVARAGLQGGALFGVRVTNGGANYGGGAVPLENAGAISGTFALTPVPNAHAMTGGAIQSLSQSLGITEFARPEDGAWDVLDPRAFYFVTTGSGAQSARLYRLTLDSLANPTGGAIELVVDRAALAPAAPANTAMFDNMTVDGDGKVLIQEDPGGNAYLALTWLVDPTAPLASRAKAVLVSDAARFSANPPTGLTIDEESSGIIEVTDIVRHANWYEEGRRYYLADMQAHFNISGPLVQGGQLFLIAAPKP
jgi:hypothetical protein